MLRLDDSTLNETIDAYNSFIAEASNEVHEDVYNPVLDGITVAFLKELREYRKTGLTPEQIYQMDEEYTKLAKKLGDVKRFAEGGCK